MVCTENKKSFFCSAHEHMSHIKRGSMIMSNMMSCCPNVQQHLLLRSFQVKPEVFHQPSHSFCLLALSVHFRYRDLKLEQ